MSDTKDLPDLTDKQSAFTHGVLEGKTLKDAYIASYDCAAMSDPAIRVEASRLRASPNISLTIDIIRQAGASTAIATLENHVAELEKLKTMALNTGNYGAAVKAEELRGKASGLYVERTEDITDRDKMVEKRRDLADVIAQIQTSPTLLKAFNRDKDDDIPVSH